LRLNIKDNVNPEPETVCTLLNHNFTLLEIYMSYFAIGKIYETKILTALESNKNVRAIADAQHNNECVYNRLCDLIIVKHMQQFPETLKSIRY